MQGLNFPGGADYLKGLPELWLEERKREEYEQVGFNQQESATLSCLTQGGKSQWMIFFL